MEINGINYLLLERRGCEYFHGDQGRDDIGNYRVGSYDHSIEGKDGRNYIIEFGSWDAWTIRKTNKRTGAPLKHHKTEIVKYNALLIDTEFEKPEDGGRWFSSWHNSALEAEQNAKRRDYSKAGILETVNEISKDHFDDIKWITTFDTYKPANKNWTPAQLICEWSKKNHLESVNTMDGLKVKNNFGLWWRFLYYQIEPGNKDNAKITVYLERA